MRTYLITNGLYSVIRLRWNTGKLSHRKENQHSRSFQYKIINCLMSAKKKQIGRICHLNSVFWVFFFLQLVAFVLSHHTIHMYWNGIKANEKPANKMKHAYNQRWRASIIIGNLFLLNGNYYLSNDWKSTPIWNNNNNNKSDIKTRTQTAYLHNFLWDLSFTQWVMTDATWCVWCYYTAHFA